MKRLTTLCLFGWAAWIRPDVAVGVVVLGAIFIPLERVWPVHPSPVLRPGWTTDIVHFVVDQVLAGFLLVAIGAITLRWLDPLVPDADRLVSGPALWVVAACVGEVAGYWGHRAMHEVPVLWRLHAVHHSSPVLDWLAPNRRHVLDTTLGQAASLVPLLALGLAPPVIVGAFVLRRAQGLFVHANIRCRVPVLRWLVATPEFHHWHHDADPRHHGMNFAGQCPLVDLMFGTLHLPASGWPEGYGITAGPDPLPAGYLARLAWPFRRTVPTARVAA